MLTQKTADWYMTGTARRLLHGSQLCGYGSGSDARHETLSLHVVGPLPAAVARADYQAAYRAARETAEEARRLPDLGPREAFGYENVDPDRGTASIVFLDGRWTGTVAIDAPALTGDASIEELSRLVKRTIWQRWTRQRP